MTQDSGLGDFNLLQCSVDMFKGVGTAVQCCM